MNNMKERLFEELSEELESFIQEFGENYQIKIPDYIDLESEDYYYATLLLDYYNEHDLDNFDLLLEELNKKGFKSFDRDDVASALAFYQTYYQ